MDAVRDQLAQSAPRFRAALYVYSRGKERQFRSMIAALPEMKLHLGSSKELFEDIDEMVILSQHLICIMQFSLIYSFRSFVCSYQIQADLFISQPSPLARIVAMLKSSGVILTGDVAKTPFAAILGPRAGIQLYKKKKYILFDYCF